VSEVLSNPGLRAEAIQRSMAVLKERWEFKPFQLSESIVRLENRYVYLAFHHGDPERGIGLTFGPLKATGQSVDTFEIEELVEMISPGTPLPFRTFPVRSWQDLQVVMSEWANFLIGVGAPVLRCDRKLFDQLALKRREIRNASASEVTSELVDRTSARVVVRGDREAEIERPDDADLLTVIDMAERLTQETFQISLEPGRFDDWQTQVNQMKPHPGDYPLLFTEDYAELVQLVYQDLWDRGVVAPKPLPGQDRILATGCYSEWLRSSNQNAGRFPPVYREIARMFQPNVVWLMWRYLGPGKVQSSTYDGLVWLGKYWAWFPGAHQALVELLDD